MKQCSLGHVNSDSTDFCTTCGQQLLAAQAPQVPQASATPPVMPPGMGSMQPGMPPVMPQMQAAVNPSANPWASPPPPVGGWQPPTYQQAAPSRSSNRGWIIGGVAAGVVVLLLGAFFLTRGGSGGGIIPPSTKALTVTLDVYTDDFSGCNLGLGYADVPGSVVVVEVDGKVAGTSDLGLIGDESGISCTFTAVVPGIPVDGTFYEISIGSRGTGTATGTELKGSNWTYSATLGL
jgi:hypothetical protein